jgi:hypothetical protein
MFLSINWADVNLWAVLAAGVANIVTCLVLYLPKLFGNAWVRLTGKSLNPARQWIPVGFAGHILNAFALAVIVVMFNATTLIQGIEIALLGWIGFFIPVETGEMVWDKIPFRLFLIRAGIMLVAECVTAIILVIWR